MGLSTFLKIWLLSSSMIFLAACATSAVELERPRGETLGPGMQTFDGAQLSSNDSFAPFDADRKATHPFFGLPKETADSMPSDEDFARSSSTATAALWWNLYKNTYSRIDGPTCEFSPSCSRFGLEAVGRHGLIGVPMTFGRLLRHHDHDFYRKEGRLLADPLENYSFWRGPHRLDAIDTHDDLAHGWYGHVQTTRRLDLRRVSDVAPGSELDPGSEPNPDSEPDPVPPASPPAPGFDQYLAFQATLEARLGTALFRQGDDYRAITSLKRYQLLDGSPQAHFMTGLMIGEIYRRNDYPGLAIRQFEQAVQHAPDPAQATYGYLMAMQELCVSLSIYGECYLRLSDLEAGELDVTLKELVSYQKLYAEVVLRSPNLSAERGEGFEDTSLRTHALDLLERHEAFERLPLKRPWLAGGLSALVPGAGQAYNGRWLDAAIALGFNALFGAATYYSAVHLESLPLSIAGGALATGFYTGNVINAVVDSRRINAERMRSFFDDLARDHWPRVSFGIDEDVVQFRFQFDWPGSEESPAPVGPTLPDIL
ncbi:MAG: membrane protein insertion efficiency factor YidD [Bradymonadaceae bacterium]